MSLRPGTRDFVWMACGAAVLAAVVASALHFGDKPSAAEAWAAHGRKLALVDQMRVALASAAGGELGAVLGASDQYSQRFAAEARAALADLEGRCRELESLIRTNGHGDEAALLADFSTSFSTLRQVDDELLDLATRNTNLKASALAQGPLAEASRELQQALSTLAAADAPDPARPLVLALGAEVAALRIQAGLPAHIAEAFDDEMDRMEAAFTKDAEALRGALDDLRALPGPAASAELPAAEAAAARFLELEAEILRLSRENTNVRSLAIALDRRQAALVASQQALDALRQAIGEEPVAPVSVAHPR